MTRDEIERSADVFTIELIDMQQHHRVRVRRRCAEGSDDSDRLASRPGGVRIARETLSAAAAPAAGRGERLAHVGIADAVRLFVRHPFSPCADGAGASMRRWENARRSQALAKQIGFDPSGDSSGAGRAGEAKSDRSKFDVADVFARYLAAVEQVTAAVDRMLDSGNTGPFVSAERIPSGEFS